MASAAEQLAANINWSAFAKADELKKRIWFTLGALVISASGPTSRCPASTSNAFQTAFLGQKQGVLDMFNMFSGGAVQRMAIFALNIMPYISASIIIQLLSSVIPSLEAIKKEGEQGRKVLNQYTRYLTVALAMFQAYGISIGLEGTGGRRQRSGAPVPHFDDRDADRRDDVPRLARRADHFARRRQRLVAHHLRRHRRAAAAGDRAIVRARPARVDFDRPRARRHRDGVRRGRLHRVHGARATARADHLSPPSGRQQDVRGAELVSAAEAQHLGRHSADFRLLAAASAGDGREFRAREREFGYPLDHHGAARARQSALPRALCRADRVLRLLLHRDRLQSGRHRRQPEEARRLHSGRASWRTHGAIHRLHSDPGHRARRRLSCR